ncbi:MBL fold metallo-hydrolase [Thermodesulfobacteriota bacterium]
MLRKKALLLNAAKYKKLKLFVFCFITIFSTACAAQMPYSAKSHHTKNGFRNLNVSERHGFLDFLKWRWQRRWKKRPDAGTYHFPLANNDPAFLKSNINKTTLTWIGHATLLLQLEGKNILTDPLFSQRAAPVQWAGPRRVVAPGLSLKNLPPIDIVVISHDHYDALDKQSIVRLHQKSGGANTIFYVPLGLKNWFTRLGISSVVELDWWEQRQEKNLRITAVPVQHWSKRSLFSRNKTLWAGWIIQSDTFRFFFCGDSGYTALFKEIGAKLGPFDLSALPIGAYEPRWFMRRHHITPEEALQVHLDLQSKKSVGIHWGTLMLTDEPLDEPPRRLKNALKEKGNPIIDFTVLQHGETLLTLEGNNYRAGDHQQCAEKSNDNVLFFK